MSRRHAPTERYWVHSDPTEPPDRPDPCPGPCNRAYRQADVTTQPDGSTAHHDPHGERIDPVPGQPVWCRPCATSITTALGRIPDLLTEARSRTDGRLNTGRDVNDKVPAGKRTGSPTGSASFDLIDEVSSWLADQVDELAEHLGHTTRSHRATRERVGSLTASIRYLTNHATAWLCTPWAGDSGRQTHGWVVQLERATGMDRLRHRLKAPCPSCDRLALARDDGADLVQCGACDACWDVEAYDRLVRVLVDEERRRSRARVG